MCKENSGRTELWGTPTVKRGQQRNQAGGIPREKGAEGTRREGLGTAFHSDLSIWEVPSTALGTGDAAANEAPALVELKLSWEKTNR